ncbi:unnamed protein product [Penicillium roqueforti FM164]|uniref:Genomic scaffold, ProqFM164S02 n=1 Tax=Penicillium roqueforti (strain FM164) TaxID=1365484 RepID=W6QDW0_PENRF|nr:unnamed protein product [Penicillium roqueforti FM164]
MDAARRELQQRIDEDSRGPAERCVALLYVRWMISAYIAYCALPLTILLSLETCDYFPCPTQPIPAATVPIVAGF